MLSSYGPEATQKTTALIKEKEVHGHDTKAEDKPVKKTPKKVVERKRSKKVKGE